MNEQTLQDAVHKAAAEAAAWVSKIKGLHLQIADSNSIVTVAKKQREHHALSAKLGDQHAVVAVKKARADQLAAEQELADLAFALPEAEQNLAAAEKAAASARGALARFTAEILMRERIALAGELDTAFAVLDRLMGEYDRLRGAIVNMPDAMQVNMHGMIDFEGAAGMRRLRASAPASLERLFPGRHHDEMRKEPLATSEARFWNLAPAETTSKAA